MQNKYRKVILFSFLSISVVVLIISIVFRIRKWKENNLKRFTQEIQQTSQQQEVKEESLASKCYEYEVCATRANKRHSVALHTRINYLNIDPETMSYENILWENFSDNNPKISFDLPTNLVSLKKTFDYGEHTLNPIRKVEYSFSTGDFMFSQIVGIDIMINKEDVDYWKEFYIDKYNNDIYTNYEGEEIKNIVTSYNIGGKSGTKVDFYGNVQHPFDLYYLDVVDKDGELKYFAVITVEKENLRKYCEIYTSSCEDEYTKRHEEFYARAAKRILDSIELY